MRELLINAQRCAKTDNEPYRSLNQKGKSHNCATSTRDKGRDRMTTMMHRRWPWTLPQSLFVLGFFALTGALLWVAPYPLNLIIAAQQLGAAICLVVGLWGHFHRTGMGSQRPGRTTLPDPSRRLIR